MGPSAGDRAPLPIVLLVLVAGVLAFTTDQPLVLGALAAGAVLLLLAAPGHPGRLVLVGALISAAGVLILTPLVSGQGDLVLFTIPVPPPLNGEITAEEFASSHARLVDEYEKMLERLDMKYDYFDSKNEKADKDHE